MKSGNQCYLRGVPDIDKRLLIAAPIIALVVFALGFGLGALISRDSGDTQAVGSETSSVSSATASSTPGADSTSPSSTVIPIDGDASKALIPPKTDAAGIPEYGTPNDRDNFVVDLALAGLTGASRADNLATADRICYNLERLEAQERSPAFAVRVVWNESLLELESGDLAAFSAVYAAAPFYLCPASADYAKEIAYWIGY